MTITAPVNGPPSARDDSTTTNQGSAVDVPVLNNDEDPDGDQLTVELTAGPASQQGSAVVSGRPQDGPLHARRRLQRSGDVPVPSRGQQGHEEQHRDRAGHRDRLRAGHARSSTTARPSPRTGQPIALDLLAPGQLDFRLDVTDVQGGQVANGASPGTVIFTPAAGNNDFGSVRYTVTNSCDVSRNGSVSIDVNRVPGVRGRLVHRDRRHAGDGDRRRRSRDDDEPLTISAATPSSAIVTIEPNGSALTFRSSVAGPVTVNVTVKDPGGLETSGTLSFDVQLPANVPPTAEERLRDAEPERDPTITFDVLALANDPDGPPSGLRIELVTTSANLVRRHRRDDLGRLVARRTTGHDHVRQPCQRPRGDLLPRRRRARRRKWASRHPDPREPTPVGAARQRRPAVRKQRGLQLHTRQSPTRTATPST